MDKAGTNSAMKSLFSLLSLIDWDLSCILILCIVYIFGYKLSDMLGRNLTSVKKNSFIKSSNAYSPPENLSAKNITIAFKLGNYYGDSVLDEPSFGKFTLV